MLAAVDFLQVLTNGIIAFAVLAVIVAIIGTVVYAADYMGTPFHKGWKKAVAGAYIVFWIVMALGVVMTLFSEHFHTGG